MLKQLEDSLLARLSAASGNFLGDTALVENLEITKATATEIEEKVDTHTNTLSLMMVYYGVKVSGECLGLWPSGARSKDNRG